jgi:hypothetical protein
MEYFDLTQPGTLGLFRVVSSLEAERLASVSPEDCERFTSAIDELARFEHWLETFEMVRANEKAWLNFKADAERQMSRFELEDDQLSRIYFEANRHLLNLLSSALTFLDHTAHYLSSLFREGSDPLRQFHERRRRIYEAVFAYRFLYNLRNYAQHRGLPIGTIEHLADMHPRTREERGRLVLGFDVGVLLQDAKGWRTMRDELRQMGPKLEIANQPSEYVDSLADLQSLAIELQRPRLAAAGTTIIQVLTPVLPTAGKYAAMGQKTRDDYGNEHLLLCRPPWKLLRRLGLVDCNG